MSLFNPGRYPVSEVADAFEPTAGALRTGCRAERQGCRLAREADNSTGSSLSRGDARTRTQAHLARNCVLPKREQMP
jgi:hypothetical protein